MASPPSSPLSSAWDALLRPDTLRGVPPSARAPSTAVVSPVAVAEPHWDAHQVQFLDSSASRGCLTALAGSGKTESVMAYMRRRPHISWRYLVYNKAMEQWAQARCPSHVRVSTLHGLAFPRFGSPLSSKLSGDREAVMVPHSQRQTPWSSVYAHTLLAAVRRFSWSSQPAVRVVLPTPEERAFLVLASQARLDWSSWADDVEHLWQAMIDPGHDQPCEHDTYLKLMQLSGMQVHEKGLVLDEAQDVTPCMQAWWMSQQPLVQWRTGDPHQAIYGWRGAELPIWPETSEDHMVWPTTYRCAPLICAWANRALEALHAPHRMLSATPDGDPGRINLTTDGNHATYLARTRQGVVEQALRLMAQGRTVAARDQGLWVRLGQLDEAVARGHCLPGTSVQPGGSEWESWVGNHPDASWSMAWRFFCRWGSGWVEQHRLWQGQTGQASSHKVMTIHEAKGQAFDSVGLLDDVPVLGHPDAEERRLLYVALTRARTTLGLPQSWV